MLLRRGSIFNQFIFRELYVFFKSPLPIPSSLVMIHSLYSTDLDRRYTTRIVTFRYGWWRYVLVCIDQIYGKSENRGIILISFEEQSKPQSYFWRRRDPLLHSNFLSPLSLPITTVYRCPNKDMVYFTVI